MFVIANWKMNLTAQQAACYFDTFNNLIANLNNNSLRIGIAPSFTEIGLSFQRLSESSVWIGAQDVSPDETGACTGEISAKQLLAWGVKFVLIGHSERRMRWHESTEILKSKLLRAFESDLVPVFCIGEQKSERDKVETILERQLKPVVDVLRCFKSQELYVAYEPVWAIGTGLIPTLSDISQAHKFIAGRILEHTERYIPILYGGSVNRINARSLAELPEIKGLLVGGASLDPIHFDDIIRAASA